MKKQTNQQLKDAVQLGQYLYDLNYVNYENISTDELKLRFVEITKNVQSAVEIFRVCADFMPQTKDKHFVVMTANLIRLYLFYFSKCYPTGEDMPQLAKDALRSLVERLEELNYEKLRNDFEL